MAKTAASAAIGGTASVLSCGSFANGAKTGAFQQLFNHIAHGRPAVDPSLEGEPGYESGYVEPPERSMFKSSFEESEHIPVMSIENAVSTLNSNAHAQSLWECAKYVRLALEGGGVNTTNRPVSARKYGSLLTREGFRTISQTNYKPQAGDVVVWQAYRGQPGNHGHIQMFNGNGWVSDFRQNFFVPGTIYNGVAHEIYRP